MKPFHIRWQDIVKKIGDIASNGSVTIRQVDAVTYHVLRNGEKLHTPHTIEGVVLVLEEYGIVDEGWKMLEDIVIEDEGDEDEGRPIV